MHAMLKLKLPYIAAILLFACALILIEFFPQAFAKETAMVKVGDKAPDFSLPDQDGKPVSLKDYAGRRNIILYFYPKDDMGVCKQEACLFRDGYQSFVDAGAEVIGVSSDSVDSHKGFVVRRHLPFKLLSDEKSAVRKLYGVPAFVPGILPGRVTFVIDKQGVVRLSFNSMLHADQHVAKALNTLKEIDSATPKS